MRGLVVLCALSLGLVGCTGDADGSARDATTITISAAASLTEAFRGIDEAFEAANPGTSVALNFGSSTTLAQQIIDGAPADVFASADEGNMGELVDADKVQDQPIVIATNSLAIVVKPGNPAGVRMLADLARVEVVSLCGEAVPCGRFAQQALTAAGVTIPPERITRGQDVKATMAAVSDGDADAAIVYVTDVAAVGDAVSTVTIPSSQNVTARYPIAIVAGTRNRPQAEAFVRFVAGPAGQAVLRAHGFTPP